MPGDVDEMVENRKKFGIFQRQYANLNTLG
jgi:hypothetical protein